MDPWWTEQQAGLIGAILGAGIGVLFGGVGGGLGGPLAAKGAAKTFVYSIFITGMATGALLLIGGVTAIAVSQPRHVWLPLTLSGAALATVCGALFPIIRAAYRQHEQRRIAAHEFRQHKSI